MKKKAEISNIEISKKISKIEIKNFKSFLSQNTISFSPNLNVISGENGVGKTNLLEAILFGLGKNFTSDVISKGKKYAEVKIHFTNGEILSRKITKSDKISNDDNNVVIGDFELIDNFGTKLNKVDFEILVNNTKEKSKDIQIIAVSSEKYLLDLADEIIVAGMGEYFKGKTIIHIFPVSERRNNKRKNSFIMFVHYCNLTICLFREAAIESNIFSYVSEMQKIGAVGKGFEVKFKNQPENVTYTISDNVLSTVFTVEFSNKEMNKFYYKILSEKLKNNPIKMELHNYGIDINTNSVRWVEHTEYMNAQDELENDSSTKNQNKIRRNFVKIFQRMYKDYLFDVDEIIRKAVEENDNAKN